MKRPLPPDECSQCGAAIPRDALACPGCGADERTGWDSNPYLPGDEVLPEDDREPRSLFEPETKKRWLVVALVLILAGIYMLLERGWLF